MYGQVAQSVEQGTENPCVGSSILSLATIFFFCRLRRLLIGDNPDDLFLLLRCYSAYGGLLSFRRK
jgi:hypothetical protein